tara:strand:+ start:16271 stop:17314 length:1044 start_codon:yes stop_codon:yes gene_type:complete
MAHDSDICSAPVKVVVLLGGESSERNVSLVSGCQVADALRKAGHDVVAVDSAKDVLSESDERNIMAAGVQVSPPITDTRSTGHSQLAFLVKQEEFIRADLVFPALHGGIGENGTLQALLDINGIHYAGSGMLGCALSMDKDLTKRILRNADLPTPDWLVSPTADEVMDILDVPVIAKPVDGGSSVRLSLLRDQAEVATAVNEDSQAPSPMMYESYIEGREFTVGILGDEVLPVVEIVPKHELFDYECKYQAGMAEEIAPADIPEGLANILQNRALEVHRLLHLRDFSRVDFIVDKDGESWCIEANALPGLTGNSLLPKAALANGINFSDLCDRIVFLAGQRIMTQGL